MACLSERLHLHSTEAKPIFNSWALLLLLPRAYVHLWKHFGSPMYTPDKVYTCVGDFDVWYLWGFAGIVLVVPMRVYGRNPANKNSQTNLAALNKNCQASWLNKKSKNVQCMLTLAMTVWVYLQLYKKGGKCTINSVQNRSTLFLSFSLLLLCSLWAKRLRGAREQNVQKKKTSWGWRFGSHVWRPSESCSWGSHLSEILRTPAQISQRDRGEGEVSGNVWKFLKGLGVEAHAKSPYSPIRHVSAFEAPSQGLFWERSIGFCHPPPQNDLHWLKAALRGSGAAKALAICRIEMHKPCGRLQNRKPWN